MGRKDIRSQLASEDTEYGYIDVEKSKVVYPFINKTYPRKPEEENRLILVRKILLEYGYLPEQVDLEVAIKSGQTTLPKKADIVVFSNMEHHDPAGNAYIIAEVKKNDRTDGIDQMQTYCNNTTAEYGIWFNGREIVYQHRKREPHEFSDIPDIPRKGETLEDVGVFYKDDLIPAVELKSVFETIHNHIYANEGLLKEKVFNEMLKFIFIKMVDEKTSNDKCNFRITEGELREVHDGKGTAFASRITKLFEQVKKEYADVFSKNDVLNLRPSTIAFVVSQLQKFDLRNTRADVKGTAFQTFVYAHQRGDRGEFFTPHPVVELMVGMINPGDSEMFIDPACGSGGILVQGMNHVWEKYRRRRNYREVDLVKYAHTYIRGIDFNPDLARVSKMHMVLYDDGHTGVFSANSLEEWSLLQKQALTAGIQNISQDSYDVVLTNPPFGSKGKVTEKRILSQFELGHKWKLDKSTAQWSRQKTIQKGQVPDILFIERCLQLLREGGRMGIVLPDSDLNNISLGYVRQHIMNHCRVLAVVGLPSGTFKSSGSNPQASVLFLQKISQSEADDLNSKGYQIFMANLESIGYDLNTKTAPTLFKRNNEREILTDKEGLPLIDSDVPEVVDAFRKYCAKNGVSFGDAD